MPAEDKAKAAAKPEADAPAESSSKPEPPVTDKEKACREAVGGRQACCRRHQAG